MFVFLCLFICLNQFNCLNVGTLKYTVFLVEWPYCSIADHTFTWAFNKKIPNWQYFLKRILQTFQIPLHGKHILREGLTLSSKNCSMPNWRWTICKRCLLSLNRKRMQEMLAESQEKTYARVSRGLEHYGCMMCSVDSSPVENFCKWVLRVPDDVGAFGPRWSGTLETLDTIIPKRAKPQKRIWKDRRKTTKSENKCNVWHTIWLSNNEK